MEIKAIARRQVHAQGGRRRRPQRGRGACGASGSKDTAIVSELAGEDRCDTMG